MFIDLVITYQVANKLYPLTYISQDIEDFATKMLHTVLEMKSHSQDGAKDMTKDDVLLPQTDQVLFFFSLWDLYILLDKWNFV